MDKPLVSVIVPVYNCEKYFFNCMESILNQTYRNLEIILVDDGSSDQSGELCDQIRERDSRIHVFHQKNQGVSCARNSGLDNSTGDCILFVDSDDSLDRDMIEKMVARLLESDCDLVICDCMKEWGTHSELYTHRIRQGYFSREDMMREYYSELLISSSVEYPLTISNVLILYRSTGKRKQLRYLPGVRYSEDWLFGAQLMLYSDSFYYMKGQALYHYNLQNSGSATHKLALDKWKDYRRLYRAMKTVFGSVQNYDFNHQLDYVLLFLVWNAVGELLSNPEWPVSLRKQRAGAILNDEEVRKSLRRIRVRKLPVSRKLKIQTWMYKRRFAIGLLAGYLTTR